MARYTNSQRNRRSLSLACKGKEKTRLCPLPNATHLKYTYTQFIHMITIQPSQDPMCSCHSISIPFFFFRPSFRRYRFPFLDQASMKAALSLRVRPTRLFRPSLARASPTRSRTLY